MAVIIAVVASVTLLGAMFMMQGKTAGSDAPGRSILTAKPDIPVFITWRETKLSGQTQVARVWAKPEGELPLRVLIQIESSVSGEKKIKEVVLERRHTEDPLELGFLEGHTFVPGDKLSVGHRDYSPVTATCKAPK